MGIILAPGEVLEVELSVADELARRQRLADERAAHPDTEALWDGSTTQPDIDSHEFPIEEGCGVFCNGCYLMAEGECNCCGDCCDCEPTGCDDDCDPIDDQPRCTGLGCPGGCDRD